MILMFFFHQKKIMEEMDFRVNFGKCWWIFGFGEIVGAPPRQKNGEDASVIHPGPFSAPFLKMKSL
jgi:hypothetical protein